MNEVTGFDELRAGLAKLSSGLAQIVEPILRDEAIAQIQNAQTGARMPVRTGALADSADVDDVVEISENYWQVTLGFGGGTVSYAVVQHEGGETPTGGQIAPKKYLEGPLVENSSEIADHIGAKIGAQIEGLF